MILGKPREMEFEDLLFIIVSIVLSITLISNLIQISPLSSVQNWEVVEKLLMSQFNSES